MSAVEITRALKGQWHGSYGTAKCPAHRDKTPSLSLSIGTDGRTLVKCHAGCSQDAVLGALTALGLWDGKPTNLRAFKAPEPNRNGGLALKLWEECKPAAGTLVETYLAARGITIPIPESIRFHPGLKHPDSEVLPVMVALVQHGVTGAPVAVHRTFLKKDGTGKAYVPRPKLMLGPCAEGAVRLSPLGDRLCVAEGIESALSVLQATMRPAWAALSTSGLRRLGLPEGLTTVTICADVDAPGEEAAQAAAQRWVRAGLEVRIARPTYGSDFNDQLLRKTGGAS
jgi:putative DNA primase/helicase